MSSKPHALPNQMTTKRARQTEPITKRLVLHRLLLTGNSDFNELGFFADKIQTTSDTSAASRGCVAPLTTKIRIERQDCAPPVSVRIAD
jgi:hypothetical protein